MIITKKSWIADWKNYNFKGPARAYYRKEDIAIILSYYRGEAGFDYQADSLPDPDEMYPFEVWQNRMDVGYFAITHTAPYRVVYGNL